MARLRTPEESDDELPDIRGLILTAKAEKETWTPSLKTDTQNDRARAKRTPRKARVEAEEEEQVLTARKPAGHADNASANLILKTPRARAGETPARRQRALKGVQPNALLLPISAAIAEEPSARKKRVETGCSQAIKHTPKRAIKETVKSRATTPCPSDSEDDISEVTWCGSEESEVDSDVERRWRSSTRPARTPARKTSQTTNVANFGVCAEDEDQERPRPGTISSILQLRDLQRQRKPPFVNLFHGHLMHLDPPVHPPPTMQPSFACQAPLLTPQYIYQPP